MLAGVLFCLPRGHTKAHAKSNLKLNEQSCIFSEGDDEFSGGNSDTFSVAETPNDRQTSTRVTRAAAVESGCVAYSIRARGTSLCTAFGVRVVEPAPRKRPAAVRTRVVAVIVGRPSTTRSHHGCRLWEANSLAR